MVEGFSFLLSDKEPDQLPCYQPDPRTQLLFSYRSTRAPYLPIGQTSHFQGHGIVGSSLPVQLNGSFRLCRNVIVDLNGVSNTNLEPGIKGAKLGDIYFTFEFKDLWGVLKKVGINKPLKPLLLPNAFLPGFEGVITRQTAPDDQLGGRSMGVDMKIKDLRSF